jgi:hypothetical protein
MKSLIYFCCGLFMLAACGVQMQTQNLVDEWGNTYDQEQQQVFTDKEVFSNQTADVWGLEKTDCKHFSRIDTLAYKGKSSIKLQWNKTGSCAWLGFGIGWNGYAAKDLTPVMQNGKITFFIRAIKGTQFVPTLIFLLEDYSGIQTATLFKAKYLERYPIDEAWQKVSIPLSGFLEAAGPKSDFSNIKSLNVECQGEGAILIDEIYIEEGSKLNGGVSKKFGQTITQTFPALIFEDDMQYAWGLGNYSGRKIQIDSQVYLMGNAALHMQWNITTLPNVNNQLGFNWEQWQAIALYDSVAAYSLSMYIYAPNKLNLNMLQIGFESYAGEQVNIGLNQTYVSNTEFIDKQGNKWLKVRIPLAAFDWEKTQFNVQKFKQLLITFTQEGELWIDHIQLEKN